MRELEGHANHAIAEYNTDPHTALQERQPALVFEQHLKRNRINDFVDLKSFMLDMMELHEKVQLSSSGIRLHHLRYHDIRAVRELLDDLVPLECRRQKRDTATATVDLRMDPLDISKVYVWNRVRKTYVELKCADETYSAGMPLGWHEQLSGPIATVIRDRIMDDGVAPVVFCGSEGAEVVLRTVPDLVQRLDEHIDLEPLDWEQDLDKELLLEFLAGLDAKLVDEKLLEAPSGLDDLVVAEALCTASLGRLRPLMKIVRAAMTSALRRRALYIELDDLEDAVDRYAMRGGLITENPFVGLRK